MLALDNLHFHSMETFFLNVQQLYYHGTGTLSLNTSPNIYTSPNISCHLLLTPISHEIFPAQLHFNCLPYPKWYDAPEFATDQNDDQVNAHWGPASEFSSSLLITLLVNMISVPWYTYNDVPPPVTRDEDISNQRS